MSVANERGGRERLANCRDSAEHQLMHDSALNTHVVTHCHACRGRHRLDLVRGLPVLGTVSVQRCLLPVSLSLLPLSRIGLQSHQRPRSSVADLFSVPAVAAEQFAVVRLVLVVLIVLLLPALVPPLQQSPRLLTPRAVNVAVVALRRAR